MTDGESFQNRYTVYSTRSSEEFNAASRNVKAGMIVSSTKGRISPLDSRDHRRS